MSKYIRVDPLTRSNNHRWAKVAWWKNKSPEYRSRFMKMIKAGGKKEGRQTAMMETA